MEEGVVGAQDGRAFEEGEGAVDVAKDAVADEEGAAAVFDEAAASMLIGLFELKSAATALIPGKICFRSSNRLATSSG